ncbi:ATP-binding protein [Kitasatospora sp. NBC_00240]|uniref:ATP-binding protein n=1 Tax=Kitasatospora sp. NBC_00240 TaxID=2903567 RepID=UPI002255A718|nr:ATP-binding protein [Kitasatospora sp. NBC_00240]MCX5211241.1 ATP-binding protein [Kitasatospora sp. NBC_00240]
MQVLQVQLAVQADPAEVGRARRWVRSRLLNQGVDPDAPIAETLVLVVSELVTNAVVHTGCPAVLRLLMPVDSTAAPGPAAAGGARLFAMVGPLRVEVADASQVAPAPRHAGDDEDATNGRGLELVELLCDRWGWYPDGSGKRVWCEIDAAATAVRPMAGGLDAPLHDSLDRVPAAP